jgi:long-chain acyl-CoA synthetase
VGAEVERAAPASEIDPERLDGRTLPGVFFRQAHMRTDQVVLRHHDGQGWREVTWGRYRDLALRIGAALVEAGLEDGERVALMAHNRLEWLACDLGIQCAGGIGVPIYPSTTARVAATIVGNCEARFAIAEDAELAKRLEGARPLEKVFTIEADVPRWIDADPESRVIETMARRLSAIEPDRMATIIYTSGTTGDPKGVVLSHANMVDMARAGAESFDITDRDVSLSFLPY